MENLQDSKDLTRHIDDALKVAEGPLFIGITGLGGSGKSTLMDHLTHHYHDAACVPFDYFAFATADRKQRIADAVASQDMSKIRDTENPQNWYDWPRIYAALDDLRAGRDVHLADAWNQKTGLRDMPVTFAAPSQNGLILVDCIYLGHPDIRQKLDFAVLVDTPLDVAINRQRQRDDHRSDPVYLDFKARLARDYAQPYLDRYAASFDWRISGVSPFSF